jgi:DNA-binding MarR family transcriptional regulator
MVETSSLPLSLDTERSEKLKRFYPKVAIRILFYLRRMMSQQEFLYLNQIERALDIPKSILSNNFKILDNCGLIRKEYHIKKSPMDPFLRVSITLRGLELVEDVLNLGLTPREIHQFSF